MTLITAHKILITCGILFFLFFGIRELIHTPGQVGDLRFAFAMLGALGLMFYLRWIIRTYSKRS